MRANNQEADGCGPYAVPMRSKGKVRPQAPNPWIARADVQALLRCYESDPHGFTDNDDLINDLKKLLGDK